MVWHINWWHSYQTRVSTSSYGTRHLLSLTLSSHSRVSWYSLGISRIFSILANAILTSMTTSINNLPLCHWWQYIFPFNILFPFWHQWKMRCPSTPSVKLLLFIIFSLSIVFLHRFLTPPVMVLFLQAMWSMIDVSTFIHVMNQLPLMKYYLLVIKWKRSSIIIHQVNKDYILQGVFLRDHLSKNDCPYSSSRIS